MTLPLCSTGYQLSLSNKWSAPSQRFGCKIPDTRVSAFFLFSHLWRRWSAKAGKISTRKLEWHSLGEAKSLVQIKSFPLYIKFVLTSSPTSISVTVRILPSIFNLRWISGMSCVFTASLAAVHTDGQSWTISFSQYKKIKYKTNTHTHTYTQNNSYQSMQNCYLWEFPVWKKLNQSKKLMIMFLQQRSLLDKVSVEWYDKKDFCCDDTLMSQISSGTHIHTFHLEGLKTRWHWNSSAPKLNKFSYGIKFII